MLLPKFKYYLRKVNGVNYDYYYRSSGTTVTFTTSGTPIHELEYAPDGWEESALSDERAFDLYDVMRSNAGGLQFVEDGALILRNEYYNGGIERQMQFYIQILDDATRTYSDYYLCEVNFNGSHDSPSTGKFIVEFLDSGFIAKLAAKKNTDYEIAIASSVKKVWVHLHPMKLKFRQTWVTTYGQDDTLDPFGIVKFYNHTPVTTEGTNLNFTVWTLDQNTLPTIPYVDKFFLKNEDTVSHDVTLTYYYDYYLHIPGGTTVGEPFKFRLFYYVVDVPTNTISGVYDIFNSTPYVSHGGAQSFQGTNVQTITLPSDNYIGVGVSVYKTTGGGAGTAIQNQLYDCANFNSTLEITTYSLTDDYYFEGLPLAEVGSQLVEKISDSSGTSFNSTLLTVEHVNKVATSGNAIRNLPNSILKTNFDDFFRSCDAFFNISFKYVKSTDAAYIENKAANFDTTQILDLGEVADCIVTPFSQEMFSKLVNCQSTFTYDESNGKDEVQTETQWQLPITRVTTEKNLKAGYRTDNYGILFTALNLTGKTVTDAKEDDDIFVMHINDHPDGTIPNGHYGAGNDYYNLFIDGGVTVSNVYDGANRFNIYFSPKRELLRWGNYIHGLLYGLDSSYIKFQTKGQTNSTNTKMSTFDGVTTIDEGTDILVSDLDTPMFKPFVFDVMTKVPIAAYSTLASTPYGYVKFTWDGNVYYGFILKVSQTTALDQKQTWKLLATNSSDLTKLIH